jgi:type III secretion protein J
MGKGSLVPSGAVEHAQLLAGLSGELERTLCGIDGVVSARVHVSIPPPDPLGDRGPRRPSASVLLKHRGATTPIEPPAVQRLVAGAVSGMAADDVAVVLVSRPAPPGGAAAGDRNLVHLGPIAVTRASVAYLRALVAAAITLSVLPTTALLALWLRGRRQAQSEEP